MLGLNVHSDLGQIQIAANASGGGDSGGVEHIQQNGTGQLLRRHAIGVQIGGYIQKYLVNGVDMHVLWGDIFQIHVIDAGAERNIVGHLWRGHQVVQSQVRPGQKLGSLVGGSREDSAWGLAPPLGVDLLHLLHHFKEPGPPGDAVGFQGRRHRQTDGLLGTALVGHHQMGGHGVQSPLHALHGGIKGFQING